MSTTLLTLVSHPLSDNFISKFQSFCGVNCHGKASNNIIHYCFKIWSILGEEIFCLLPMLLWFFLPLGIRFVTNFGIILTLGQLLKEYCKLPRPSKDSVAKLEKAFETEYGLPSTHTITSMLPMSILYSLEQHSFPVDPLWWRLAWLHVLITGLSRMYLGVHSPADIIAGATLGFIGTRVLDIYGDYVDQFLYSTTSGFILTLLTLLAFVYLHPRAIPWRVSYSTTATIYGTWFGVCISLYVGLAVFPGTAGYTLQKTSFVQYGPEHWYNTIITNNSSKNNNMNMNISSMIDTNYDRYNIYIIIYKLIIGLIILGIVKFLVKSITLTFLLRLYEYGYITRISGEEADPFGEVVPVYKAYNIDIPVK